MQKSQLMAADASVPMLLLAQRRLRHMHQARIVLMLSQLVQHRSRIRSSITYCREHATSTRRTDAKDTPGRNKDNLNAVWLKGTTYRHAQAP